VFLQWSVLTRERCASVDWVRHQPKVANQMWPAITDYIASRVECLRRAAPAESLLHGLATDRQTDANADANRESEPVSS
jgi:hypothetical protein